MNHAAGGCCGGAAAQATKAGEDHSAHQAGQPVAKAGAAPMEHGTGASCCAGMKHDAAPAAKAEATPMEHGAGASCCAGMKHDAAPAAKAEATPMEHGAGASCCAGMKHDAAPAAKTMDHGAGGCCSGTGAMAGMGDASMMSDMQVFHFLLENRADVRRTVTMLPNGIDTLTESDTPEIAQKIKTHVSAMYGRLKDGRRIHQRDPLFVELFEHADQVDMSITYTDKGLRVIETSDDPAVATLLHKHAETVNGFIKNGMPEMMKNHLE
ncbi:MAG: hypothetical protein U0Q55_20280 [Vicinamibacterales bacterium]